MSLRSAILSLVLVACVGKAEPVVDDTEAPAVVVAEDLALTVHAQVSTILLATWTQEQPSAASWVAYSFDDTTLTTPVIPREAGPAQAVLLGIPSDTEVSVQVWNEDAAALSSAALLARTGPLPEDLPEPEVWTWDPLHASPEPWMLLTVSVAENWYFGPFYAVIVNRSGRIVWYWVLPDKRTSLYAQPGWDGRHLLVDANGTFSLPDPTPSRAYRMTLDLARLEIIELPDFKFALDEEDNGALLYARRVRRRWTLTRHNADGSDTDLWSCTRYLMEHGLSYEPCGANTLVWDAERHTVLYSMPEISTVVEIDTHTGEVLRHFGGLWGGWTLDPPSSALEFQHYANWTPEGTILVSTHVVGEEGAMRAREFAVDESTETLTEIWSYGESGEHYAKLNGEAIRLANGHTLIGYGSEGSVIELDADDALVWDLRFPDRGDAPTFLIGHSTLLDDLYALNGEGP